MDGQVGPVDYNSPLMIDGIRLIKVDEFSNNIIYQTEQGNIRVTGYIGFLGVNVFKYFKVLYPNGMIGIFGDENSTPDQNLLYYPLTKLTDVSGNYMSFSYEFRNEQYYIKRIDYGASETNSEHFASVRFDYKTRADVTSGFVAGMLLTEDYLLEKISCYSENTLFRTYRLSYETNMISLLTQVDCSANGTGLNPLKFYYGDNGQLMDVEKKQLTSYKLDSHGRNRKSEGKMTSKASFKTGSSDDALIVYRDMNPYNVKYSDDHKMCFYHNEFDEQAPNGTVSIFYEIDGEVSKIKKSSILFEQGFIQLFATNVDETPIDEIVKINNSVVNNRDIVTISLYKPLPDFSGQTLYLTKTFDMGEAFTDDNGHKSIPAKSYFPGDYNGDGKNELFVVIKKHNSQPSCLVINLENLMIFLGERTFNLSPQNDLLYSIDYDGDGKAELCQFTPNEAIIYTLNTSLQDWSQKSILYPGINVEKFRYANVFIGDVNGDGKTDFIIRPGKPRDLSPHRREIAGIAFTALRSGSGSLYVPSTRIDSDVNSRRYSDIDYSDTLNIYLSKGNGAFKRTQQILSNNKRFISVILQDVNNDDLLDLVYKDESDQVHVHLNINGTINEHAEPVTIALGGEDVLIPSDVAMGDKFFSHMLCISDSTLYKLRFTRNEGKQRLLIGIVNSNGVVSKTEYTPLNGIDSFQKNFNKDGVNYPFQSFIAPLPVVTKTESYLNNIQLNAMQYDYANAVLHRHGLGFLGFELVTTKDLMRNRTMACRYNLCDTDRRDSYLHNTIAEQEVLGVSKTQLEYEVSRDWKKISRVLLKKKTSYDYLIDISITSTYRYDEYGNPTYESVDYGKGLMEYNTCEFLNKRSETENIIGLPIKQTHVRSREGSTWTTSTEISYDNYSRPVSNRQMVEGQQVSEAQHGYNAMGGIASEKSRNYNSSDWLENKYEYSPNGRFLTKSTDPMGLSTTYTYDNDNCLLLTQTDHRGNITTYNNYDNFGRLLKLTLPDGTISQTGREWAIDGADQLSRVVQAGTGKPTSVIYYDGVGREMKQGKQGFDGIYVFTQNRYDRLGRLTKQSAPYKQGEEAQDWTETAYDDVDRIQQITQPTGRTIGYTYSGNSITTNDAGLISTRHYNAWRELLSATDPGGSITYTYRPDGQPLTVNVAGVNSTFEYDNYGRQTAIVDPSAGRQSYTYDVRGNMETQTDAENRTVSTTYNNFGQPLTKTHPEFTLTYNYDPDYYTLISVTSSNGSEQSFTYDNLGRVETTTERVDQTAFTKAYTYADGKLASVAYSPISQPLNYAYNNYGYLNELKLADQSIWKLNGVNHLGQPLSKSLGNGVVQKYAYTTEGFPNEMKAIKDSSTLQFMQYEYDTIKGLLTSRNDATHGLSENFVYDDLLRLATYGQNRAPESVGYAYNGNISTKTDVGTFAYEVPGKPFAVSGLTGNDGSVSAHEQNVSYTSFQRPAIIEENGYRAVFTYLANYQRAKMQLSYIPTAGETGEELQLTRYYLGDNYEKETDDNGATTAERIYLGGTAYNAPAVFCNEDGNWKLRYLHRDRQGSITQISDEIGNKIAEYSYDAWGRLRNPQTLTCYVPDAHPTLYLSRGYTGHEYLPWFGLLNMNARLYDPVLGRFLAPDPYVQMPDFTQSYNRYAYCMNNPLSYVDEDGEWLHIVIGAVAGGIINLVANWNNIDGLWDGLTVFGVGAGAGALTTATAGAGASIWTVMGVSGGASAITTGTNNLVAQTGEDFSGIDMVDWGQVWTNAGIGFVSGTASAAAGTWAANSSMLVNNVNSPLLRSAVASPLAAGAGHVAGGIAAGLLSGQSFDNAFYNSFNGIGSSMLIGLGTGLATTVATCYAAKINPITGKSINSNSRGILSENGIFGTQEGFNPEIVDMYLDQMKTLKFDLNKLENRIGGYEANGKYYIGEGHHKMIAAYRYYQQTGNSLYIEFLINTGRWTPASPLQYGLKIYKLD